MTAEPGGKLAKCLLKYSDHIFHVQQTLNGLPVEK